MMEHILTLTHIETPRLAVSLSPAFHNKRNLTQNRKAFSVSFAAHEISVEGFVQHVLEGKAWAQGVYRGGRGKVNFVSSQTLALDFDEGVSVDIALENPFIHQYAALVHPSPTSTSAHPKTRVIFILSEPVDHASVWETLQRGLIEYVAPMNPDPSCKDAARMFFGCDVPGAYSNIDARLPIELAGAFTRDEAHSEMEREIASRQAPKLKNEYKGVGKSFRELVIAVEDYLGVSGAQCGSSGFTFDPIPCPIKRHEHDDERPATYWHTEKKFAFWHNCHCTYLTHEFVLLKELCTVLRL